MDYREVVAARTGVAAFGTGVRLLPLQHNTSGCGGVQHILRSHGVRQRGHRESHRKEPPSEADHGVREGEPLQLFAAVDSR